MFGYRSIVSVISIIIYLLLGLLAVWICFQRSFGSVRPWIFLVTFCILRIIGDGFTLAVENSDGSPAKGLITGAAICNSIGLGPLLIVATQILRQANACLYNAPVPNQTERALVTFDICVVLSTILAINGGATSFNPDHSNGKFEATATLEAGVCLYAGSLACIQAAALFIFFRRGRFEPTISGSPRSFALVVILVFLSLAILVVRLIYALILVFGSSSDFSPFHGSETIQLCMQYIEEWAVTKLFCLIGLLTRHMAPPARAVDEKARAEGPLRRALRFVPFVHWFVR